MSLSAIVLRAIAIVMLISAAAHAADWPQWRGPQRNGHSEEKGLLENWNDAQPKLLWMGDGLGGGYASVTIADGMLYTTGNLGEGQAVVAVDAETGKIVWKQALTDGAPKHGHGGARCSPSSVSRKARAAIPHRSATEPSAIAGRHSASTVNIYCLDIRLTVFN